MNVSKIRREIEATRNGVFLDHAAVAPFPKVSIRAATEVQKQFAAGHGLQPVPMGKILESARKTVADFVGASPEEIAFTKNTAEGISFVAAGFPWKKGDNLVSVEVEYPANVYPWMVLKDRGVELRRVKERKGRISFSDIKRKCDGRTRIVAISWVQFLSGYRTPLLPLARFCQRKGIRLVVDAIQGLGALPLDLRQVPIDYLAAGGHKWMLCPAGVGILFVRKSRLNELTPYELGAESVKDVDNYLKHRLHLAPTARRFECGMQDFAQIAAFERSVELLGSFDGKEREARVLALTDRLVGDLQKRKGYRILSPREPGEGSGIVSFQKKDRDMQRLWMSLRKRKFALSHRFGWLRASPHIYNTDAEIKKLLAALP